jgi:hypothetical protein
MTYIIFVIIYILASFAVSVVIMLRLRKRVQEERYRVMELEGCLLTYRATVNRITAEVKSLHKRFIVAKQDAINLADAIETKQKEQS